MTNGHHADDGAIQDHDQGIKFNPKHCNRLERPPRGASNCGTIGTRAHGLRYFTEPQARRCNALDSRALVHLKRSEFDKAIVDYDAALNRNPEPAFAV